MSEKIPGGRVDASAETLETLVRLGYEMGQLSQSRCCELLQIRMEDFKARNYRQDRIINVMESARERLRQTPMNPHDAAVVVELTAILEEWR